MATANPKDIFVRLLSDVRPGTERTTRVFQGISQAAIVATTLALSLTAFTSMAGDELSQVAEQLKTALAAEPVEITQKGGSVTLTSSADAMFPSGGWQVPSPAPLLDKMLPTLSKLQNTKIIVAGYTDNVPVGAGLQAKGVSNNLDLSAERAVAIATYLTSHGVKPDLISAHAPFVRK